MGNEARYDGLADWYDAHLSAFTESATSALARLLGDGDGDGELLDIGCGGGHHLQTLVGLGWRVTAVDLSADQLRVAAGRAGGSARLVLGDATALPFPDATFDAAVSIFTHTDIDDFGRAVHEAARVLRATGRLVHIGVHPCFNGPHALYVENAPPILFDGYADARWTDDAPGFGEGLRRRVGAWHRPLASLLNAFLEAGFVLKAVEEPAKAEEYPRMLALAFGR